MKASCSRHDFSNKLKCQLTKMIDMVTINFKISSVLLLVFIVSAASDITKCPLEFQGRCQCGNIPYGPERKMTFVTNCTNFGFDNADMLQKLPLETEILIFVGNEVRTLPMNIFSLNVQYDRLHTIDLSNNKIQLIRGKTFHKVTSVRKLILNDNDIHIVSKEFHHPRMFTSFEDLEELYLRNAFARNMKYEDYLSSLAEIFEVSTLEHLKILDVGNNGIFQLPSDEFCSLPSLEELYLSDNRLTDIRVNFTCLTKLRKLDFSKNNITSLPKQTLANFQNLSNLSLNISHNPFKCDCDMLETYKWMMDTKIDLVDRETLQCSDNFEPNGGKYVFSVPKEEFRCADGKDKDSGATITHHIILAFGIIILFIVVVLLLHKNRQQVSAFLGRFVQPIRNKFQYVSLERRDNSTLDV